MIHGVAKSRTQLSDWTELNWINESTSTSDVLTSFASLYHLDCPGRHGLHFMLSKLFIGLLVILIDCTLNYTFSSKPFYSFVHPLLFVCRGCLYSMKVKVAQSYLTLWDPRDYTVHGTLQARILEWVAFPFSMGSSQSGIEPRSPTLQVDSLASEPPGKPKNTGVGSLSLLQGIFLTQESNQGLLHCRRILYHLSHQRSSSLW